MPLIQTNKSMRTFKTFIPSLKYTISQQPKGIANRNYNQLLSQKHYTRAADIMQLDDIPIK